MTQQGSAPLTLYALPHSYYSGKTRSYLRYKKIPYVEKNLTLRNFKFIVKRTGVKYIPVIHTADDAVVQDTTEIMDFLEARFPSPSVYPDTPKQKMVALLFENYGDEWMVLPAMHYRWSVLHDVRHKNDVLEHFGLVLGAWVPKFIRRRFGWKMCQPFFGSLPNLGVTPRTIPAIEAGYEEFLRQMDAHFARYPYLLGGRASAGDFGLMGPLFAHLWRDPYPKALMQRLAPNVCTWVERMNSRNPSYGEWLPDDEIPSTLLPVLKRMCAEHLPVQVDTVRRLEQWLELHPGERIPRGIGKHRFRLGALEDERVVFPYTQWMFQRLVDFHGSLTGAARTAVDGLLREIGGLEALQTPIRRRVKRVNNRIVAA